MVFKNLLFSEYVLQDSDTSLKSWTTLLLNFDL
jgi:hypothetical protein